MNMGIFKYGVVIASIGLIAIVILLGLVWKVGEAYLQREIKKQKQP